MSGRADGARRRAGSSASSPWNVLDRARWSGLSLIALVVFVGSWRGAETETALDDQIGWANLAVLSCVLAAYANARWVMAGRRAVGQRRVALLGDPAFVADEIVPDSGDVAEFDGPGFVAGAGLALFHRSECRLAEAREWSEGSRDEHRRAGRQPCGVCRP